MTSAAEATPLPLPLRLRVAGEIRAQMARRGVRQLDLRPVLGLSQASINAKYNGKTPWSLDDLEDLSSFLRIPLPELMSAPSYSFNDEESPRPVGGGSMFVLSTASSVLLPRLDSNQQPSGSRSMQVSAVSGDQHHAQILRLVPGPVIPAPLPKPTTAAPAAVTAGSVTDLTAYRAGHRAGTRRNRRTA